MCRCKSLARLVDLPPPSYRFKNNGRLLNRIPCLFSSDHVTIIDVASLLHQSSLPTGWKTTMTNITIKWYLSSLSKFKHKHPWPTLLSNEISSLNNFEYHQRWCKFFCQQCKFSRKSGTNNFSYFTHFFLVSDSSPVQEWLYGDHYEGRNHTRVKRGLKHNPMLPE